jgi:hypothetical protein
LPPDEISKVKPYFTDMWARSKPFSRPAWRMRRISTFVDTFSGSNQARRDYHPEVEGCQAQKGVAVCPILARIRCASVPALQRRMSLKTPER